MARAASAAAADVGDYLAAQRALYFDQLIAEDEAASMAMAIAAGGHEIAAEDRDAWVAGARPIWTAMADRLGGMERIEALARA